MTECDFKWTPIGHQIPALHSSVYELGGRPVLHAIVLAALDCLCVDHRLGVTRLTCSLKGDIGSSLENLMLLDRARSTFHSVVSAGLDESVVPSDAKHVVLTNTLALIAVVLLPGYIPFLVHFLPESKVFLLLVLACMGLYVLVPILNYFKYRLVARIYFGLVGVVTFVAFSVLGGRQSNMHLYLILGIVISFFMFSKEEKPYMFAVVSAAFGSFLGLEVWFLNHDALIEVNPFYSQTMRVVLNVGLVIYVLGFSFYIYSIFLEAEKNLELEKAKSEDLLHNILPVEIASRLKTHHGLIADRFDTTTILFADLVGFTSLSERLHPEDVVQLLNEVFSHFDALAERHGLEKIKTIGDAYMVVGGLPAAQTNPEEAIAEFALEAMEFVHAYVTRKEETLNMRVGINCGPVVAGVMGKKKFSYDLWGDSVNVAARMESYGIPGEIQVSQKAHEMLKEKYHFEERGWITVKGKGEMLTFLLKGRRSSSAK